MGSGTPAEWEANSEHDVTSDIIDFKLAVKYLFDIREKICNY